MYSRGMYVGPPGGVNISRCIAASTSRAILTRNSSQMRRGRACSSASSNRSELVSPSIHFLIDSSRPNDCSLSCRGVPTTLIELYEPLVQPTAIRGELIGLWPAVLQHLDLIPVLVDGQHFHT